MKGMEGSLAMIMEATGGEVRESRGKRWAREQRKRRWWNA
jgi:hypothetical protein